MQVIGHIDIHYVTSGTVKEVGKKKLYVLGLIDDYSRVCWLEVIDSIKSIDVMFASMDCLLRLREMYNVSFKEIMSDNGSEFASRTNPSHPFEKMLKFYDIKHRYTQPYRPQTNGKIERFWKTLENELLSGEEFETLEEFKNYITGYVIYYNEKGCIKVSIIRYQLQCYLDFVVAVDKCINLFYLCTYPQLFWNRVAELVQFRPFLSRDPV